MILTFDDYFAWLLPWEGTVYENDPDDPGGPTKYGIDQRSHPEVNIRSLTKEKAKEIYWLDYWMPIAGDLLPLRTAYAVMDCAVNCGRAQATKWLQRSLPGLIVDGRMGPKTLAAASSANDRATARRVLAQRENHYIRLGSKPRFRKFKKGWLNRNSSLSRALEM